MNNKLNTIQTEQAPRSDSQIKLLIKNLDFKRSKNVVSDEGFNFPLDESCPNLSLCLGECEHR
jgi:hypothetical protein